MEREQLLTAIAAQEQLRGLVPDEVVDAAVEALRAQLEGPPVPVQRRRQVTVLFADVSGFTAMSELLDAEIVAELMNTLWVRLDRVVVDHGGRVDKHIGDALMALWGSEATAEDDTERAVRAALALQSELQEFASSSGRDLAIRIGVNTGPVLVGPVGSNQEFTVMGDAVNTASRLEHAAPIGGVLISHDAYRQVRGVFDVESLETLTVKGKTEPLKVYLVKGAKARAFRLRSRGVEGVETSTIGREAEFASLCAAFERVAASGQCQSVVLVGDAGVGKSRLLYEFDNWLELHELSLFYFKARAIRSRSETRLGLWRDLLAFRAGVTEGNSPTAVLEKLRVETSPVLDDRETMILGLWLGFELAGLNAGPGIVSGENLATVGRAHLVAYLGSLMAESPVVMLFEDLHWADEESLELLRQLISQFSGNRLLAVAATRPERSVSGSVLDALGPTWIPISLGSLGENAARALVAEILKRVDGTLEPLVTLVVERADGNPFFIEELIKKLMDDGCILADDHDAPWTVRLDLLDDASIPRSLTGVLQARIDGLSEPCRRSLQRAAVVGRTFWDSALEALGPEPADLEPALANELIFPHRPSAFSQAEEFTFKHALLHDVAYETVLLSERPALHERAAEWLAAVVGDRRDEYLEEIAGHLLLGGQHGEAAHLLLEAASRALKAGDPSSARRLAEAGFRMHGSTLTGSAAHVVMATACRLIGDLTTAGQEAELAIRLAIDNSDDAATASAVREAFYIAEAQGAYDRCRELVETGLPIAERLGGTNLVRMLACYAISDLNDGDPAKAKETASRCLSEAEIGGGLENLIEAHKINGLVDNVRGDNETAIAHYRCSVDLATETGDLTSLALCVCNVGVTLHYMADASERASDYRLAEEAYERSLALTRRLGLKTLEARALSNLAQLRVRLGLYRSARMLAKECLALAARSGSRVDELFAILVHAEASYLESGTLDSLAHIGAVRADSALGRLEHEVTDVINRLRAAHSKRDIDPALDSGASLALDDVVLDILEREDA